MINIFFNFKSISPEKHIAQDNIILSYFFFGHSFNINSEPILCSTIYGCRSSCNPDMGGTMQAGENLWCFCKMKMGVVHLDQSSSSSRIRTPGVAGSENGLFFLQVLNLLLQDYVILIQLINGWVFFGFHQSLELFLLFLDFGVKICADHPTSI